MIKSDNVKAIISYEPESDFVFLENELPAPMQSLTGTLTSAPVKLEQFITLAKIPIGIYYGDNVRTSASDNPDQDNWRVRLAMAKKRVNAINTGVMRVLFTCRNKASMATRISPSRI